MTSNNDDSPTWNSPPWHPISNPRDLKTLGKLGEESGELSAAICRCIIQGTFGKEPVTGKMNLTWLSEEIADVEANIILVKERFGLNSSLIQKRVEKKLALLRNWHEGA